MSLCLVLIQLASRARRDEGGDVQLHLARDLVAGRLPIVMMASPSLFTLTPSPQTFTFSHSLVYQVWSEGECVTLICVSHRRHSIESGQRRVRKNVKFERRR